MAGTEANAHRVTWIGDAPAEERAGMLHYRDSDDFLLSDDPFGQTFYVIDLVQSGVAATDLIRLVRRKSSAGLVALGSHADDVSIQALDAGADATVDRNAAPAHIDATIRAVMRRVALQETHANGPWRLNVSRRRLLAPDGHPINLSRTDLMVLEAMGQADGQVVTRSTLIEKIWGSATESTDGALHAALHRLRKRVEQAGQPAWPLQAVSGFGYRFKSPLLLD